MSTIFTGVHDSILSRWATAAICSNGFSKIDNRLITRHSNYWILPTMDPTQ